MTFKSLLLTTAAFAVVSAVAAAPAAQAKMMKHHHAMRAAPKPDESAALREEVNELRQQVEALKSWRDSQTTNEAQSEAQLAQVKSQLADAQAKADAAQAKVDEQILTIPSTVKTAVAATQPKDGKLHYKGITITPGGFLAMESVYRGHQEGADIGSTFSGIPLPNVATAHSPEDRFSARQSRLSLLAEGDVSSSIHLAGYYEMDFLGAAQTANSNESNSYTPRIRVLYSTAQWDNEFGNIQLLAGQSWSLAAMTTKGTAVRTEDLPPTIDAQYSVGFVWARQPEVRLTANIHDMLSLAVSVENPATAGTFNKGQYLTGVTAPTLTIGGGPEFNSINSLSLNKYPDLIGKVAFDHKFAGHSVHLEGFGILRDFYAQQSTAGVPSGQDSTGGGLGGGAIVSVIPKVLDLQFSGLEGRGIGRYASGQLPDATIQLDGTIHPLQEFAVLAGGTFHVGRNLDLYTFAGQEQVKAQYSTSGKLNNGYGNPNYDNTGCEVYGNTANCVGNTHWLQQVNVGFWDRVYTGKFGKFQFGVQYSHTERHLFPGYGTTGQIVGGDPHPTAREDMILTSIRYYPF